MVLGVLALGIPLASAWVWKVSPHLPALLAQSLGGAPRTKFPFFPWAGYFFAGAFGSHLFRSVKPGLAQGLSLVALGIALYVGARWLPANWSPSSAWLVAYRASQGLVVLGVMNLLPARLTVLLRPYGKTSLWLYVMHLPLVYGWAGIPGLASYIGPRLSFPFALLLGVALLALCMFVTQRIQARQKLSAALPARSAPQPH